jgi:hypothetical protein
MIGVEIEALKSEGRGAAGGNGWHDTDDVAEAVAAELRRFHRMWDSLGHGAITTYTITVAPEASPRRTPNGRPLPVREGEVTDA